MNNTTLVDIEKLIAKFIIACGKLDDKHNMEFSYLPHIPSCFSENVPFKGHTVRLLSINTMMDEDIAVSVWFEDENCHAFWVNIEELIKRQPFIYASLVTHIFDMINNFEDVNEC
jgi:hypothetical protein